MKFERVKGNVPVFSGEYDGRDRTIFGGTTQSNDINQQFTPEFIKGWGIVGKNEFPTLQDFNALGFTHSALIGYLYQSGVAQWVAGADYYTGSLAMQGVDLYVAIQDKPTSQPSSLQGWRLVSPALLNTTGNSTSAPMTQEAVTDALAKKWDIQTTTGSGSIVRASELNWSAPVGIIQAYIGETAPNDKWLLCRGQTFSAESYPVLAQLLPDLKIPDLRGVALRGLDANRGFDPNRKLLSYQEDAMQNIEGSLYDQYSGIGVRGSGVFSISHFGDRPYTPNIVSDGVIQVNAVNFNSRRVARSNAQNETVMKNVAVNFIIKAR